MITTGLESTERASSLLAVALAGGDAASLLVRAGPNQRAMAQAMIPTARAHDVAILLEGDANLAAKLGVDGVHVKAGEAAVDCARDIVGSASIVGADCGNSRHAAMTAGEAGADYVGFSGVGPENDGGSIIEWWASLFEVPCVALDALSETEARRFVLDGADFITPPATMWESEVAAAHVVRSFNSMIDEFPK
jgi:thiamine-phosphate pyrophosphorylase